MDILDITNKYLDEEELSINEVLGNIKKYVNLLRLEIKDLRRKGHADALIKTELKQLGFKSIVIDHFLK